MALNTNENKRNMTICNGTFLSVEGAEITLSKIYKGGGGGGEGGKSKSEDNSEFLDVISEWLNLTLLLLLIASSEELKRSLALLLCAEFILNYKVCDFMFSFICVK